MKTYLIAFGILLMALTSCEDDDFCDKTTTPRLIIGFYDKDSPESRKDVPIYVWAENKDSIYQLAVVDSILLPLDTQNNNTIYKFATTNIVDQIEFAYTTSDVFLSESCGFIAHFNDFTITNHSNNWINGIEISSTNIENEAETHVKIYH